MKTKTFSAWVLVHDNHYLRFSSYSKANYVDNLLGASLYTRMTDAEKRRNRHVWINGVQHQSDQLYVWRVELRLVDEEGVKFYGKQA